MSIIEKKEFWFSESQLLNDLTEISYGYKFYKEKREDMMFYGRNPDPKLREKIMHLLERMDDMIFKNNLQVFIGSFSLESDLLSQWRSYSNSGGVAVGISELTRFGRRPIKNIMGFHKCIYNQNELKKTIRAFLKEFIENLVFMLKNRRLNPKSEISDFLEEQGPEIDLILKSVLSEAGEELPEDFQIQRLLQNFLFTYAWKLILLLARSKNTCFKEENEIRYIRILSPDDYGKIFFRSTDINIVPYIKMPLQKDDIKEVVIGPSKDSKNLLLNIKGFLNKNDFTKCKVLLSEIPLR